MAKSRAQQAAIAISMKKAGKKPKSLTKAQVGKQVSDSVFNKKYNPDPGFFKTPPKDWNPKDRNPKDIDPGFSKGPKGNYTPKKPKLSKDGYLQYKKGGSTPAWTRKEGKSESGGLNAKGVASYRRENPGSKLKTAVTTKPSKLDPDSKDAKRRRSFCSRMSGMKKKNTSAKTANDPNSRINKSLRKWNC